MTEKPNSKEDLELHLNSLLCEEQEDDCEKVDNPKLGHFRILLTSEEGDDSNYQLFLQACSGYENRETLMDLFEKINSPDFLTIFQDSEKTKALLEGLNKLKHPSRIGFIVSIIKYINNGNFISLFQRFIRLAEQCNLDQLRNLEAKYFAVLVRLYPGEENIEHWIDLAVDFSKLGYPVTFFTDDIKDFIEKFSDNDIQEVTAILVKLATEVKKTGKLSLKRVLAQVVELDSKELDIVNAILKFIRVGIYPTERLVRYYLKLETEKEQMEFEALVEEKLQKISHEHVNPNNDLERELFYSHLGVNVGVDRFNELLEKHASTEVHFEHEHIRSFKIRANGVEVITENVDLPYVFDLRDRMLGLSHDDAILGELRCIESLPKTAMTAKQKAALQDEIIAVVTGEAKRMQDLETTSAFYDKNSALGQVNKLEKMEDSQTKLMLLMRTRVALGLLITDNKKLSKIVNLTGATKDVMNKNTTTAIQERAQCRINSVKTAATLLQKLNTEDCDIQAVDALIEFYYEISFSGKPSKEEAAILPQLRRALYQTSLSMLERERALMPKVLGVAAGVMYNMALENPQLMDRVVDLLIAQVFRDNVELMEVFSSNDIGRILEKAYTIFTERLPALLEENLMSLHNVNHQQGFVKAAVRLVNDDVVLLVKNNMMKQVRSTIFGGLTAVSKRSKNAELTASVNRYLENLENKLREVTGDFDNPPSYIHRNYNPENIEKISKSLKFHTTRNRTLDKMGKIKGLSKDEKAMVEGVKKRMVNAIGAFKDCADLLKELEKMRVELGSVASLAEMRQFFADAIAFVDAKTGKLSHYKEYRLQLAQIEEHKVTVREAAKNSILGEYQQECANGGKEFDVGELNRRTLEVIKKIDKEAGKKMKGAKKEYEKKALHECKLLDLYTKLKQILLVGYNLCDFEGALEEKYTGPIKDELSKISFIDTNEDELEVEISKRLGDAYKGFVSADCSPSHGGDKHIHVKSFFNARIYKRIEGQRKWVGNGYILDAEVHGVPVLILDALQLPNCEVNHRQFIRNFVEGIASSAQQSGYRYIISNQITSHYSGYLVSNSPKLREAYMKEYADAEVLTLDEGDIAIDNPDGLFFQSLKKSNGSFNGSFKVLWQAPDIELAHAFEEVEELLAGKIDDEDKKLLQELYSQKKLFLETYILTDEGFKFLESIVEGEDKNKLSLYIKILSTLVERRIRLTNFEQLSDIFTILFEIIEIDENIFHALVGRNVFDVNQLKEARNVLRWANDDADKRCFVSQYFKAGVGQNDQIWVENTYAVIGRFDSELYPRLLSYLRISKFESALRKLKGLADWLESSDTKYSNSTISLVLEHGLLQPASYQEIFDLIEVFRGVKYLNQSPLFLFIVQFIKVSGVKQISELKGFLKRFMENKERWKLEMGFLDNIFRYGVSLLDCKLEDLSELVEVYSQYTEAKNATYVHDFSDIVTRNKYHWGKAKEILEASKNHPKESKEYIIGCLAAGRINHAGYVRNNPANSVSAALRFLLTKIKDGEITPEMEDPEIVQKYLQQYLGGKIGGNLQGFGVFALGANGEKVFYNADSQLDLSTLIDPKYLKGQRRDASVKFANRRTEESLLDMKRRDEIHLRAHQDDDDYDEEDTDTPDSEEGPEKKEGYESIDELFDDSPSIYGEDRHYYTYNN